MRVGFVRNVGLGMVALVGLGLAGCDDSPTDFDNAQTVKIFTNPSAMVVPAGRTALLESRTENAGNAPTFEEITATVDATCGAGALAIDVAASFEPTVQPPGRFDVTGGTTVGATCINLSGGGASAVVEVTVVGDSLQILNAVDTLTIGDTLQLSSVLMADDGTPVSGSSASDVVFTSDDEEVVSVSAAGQAVAVGAGAATVTATYTSAGATVTDQVTITVVAPAPVLTSTDVGSADPGDLVTVTGTGIIPAAHAIFVDGLEVDPFLSPMLVDGTTATFRMPPGADGAVSITIGVPGDVSNALSVTRTGDTEPDDTAGSATLITLPADIIGQLTSTGDDDDFYQFTLAAPAMVDMFLDWSSAADYDLIVRDLGGVLQCFAASSAQPEATTCDLAAGSYTIQINNYDHVDGIYNLTATPQP